MPMRAQLSQVPASGAGHGGDVARVHRATTGRGASTGRLGQLINRLPLASGRPLLRYGFAVLGFFVALAVRYALTPVVGNTLPFTTFFLTVIIIAFLLGRGPATLTAVLGALAGVTLFGPPVLGADTRLTTGAGLLAYVLLISVLLLFVSMVQAAKDQAVREREVSTLLFRELQHRVSNNIQVIAALLGAQKRRISDPAARLALDEAANRLTVIGRISRELYRPDGACSNMRDFLERLSDDVLDTSGRRDVTCSVIECEVDTLDSDQAVPLALVFTEALSNALEHGLPDGGGRIDVHLRRLADQSIELTVVDDGRGLPEGFDIAETNSLGLRIARQLAQQLGGHFDLAPRGGEKGTIARLSIAA